MRRVIFLLALVAFPAFAGDVTLSWTPPVRQEQCVDAGVLENLAGFRIYKLVADITDPTQTDLVHPDQQIGIHSYTATAYTTTGEESRLTQPAEKTVDTFGAKVPTVYYVIQQTGRFVLLPIGTVPLDTACDQDQEVNGHFAVPASEVTWTGTARPRVVVAQCG